MYAERLGIEPSIPVATDRYNVFHADVLAKKLLAENRDSVRFYLRCCSLRYMFFFLRLTRIAMVVLGFRKHFDFFALFILLTCM